MHRRVPCPQLWNSFTGAALHSYDGHRGPVHRATFSADGLRVLASSNTGRLKVPELSFSLGFLQNEPFLWPADFRKIVWSEKIWPGNLLLLMFACTCAQECWFWTLGPVCWSVFAWGKERMNFGVKQWQGERTRTTVCKKFRDKKWETKQ